MYVMLGNYTGIEYGSDQDEREIDVDLELNELQQIVTPMSEDIRCFLNTNSTESSEMTKKPQE